MYLAWGLPESETVSNERSPVFYRDAAKSMVWQLVGVVIIFLVLIWSDSAAFTQIQETPNLKAASWSGTGALWSIGLVHFVAAVAGGWLMDWKCADLIYLLALVGLAGGFYGLEMDWLGLFPAWVYAGAVSLYSTALIAVALTVRTGLRPTLVAGVIFGISGWVGSAMGIGMVQDLGRVPLVYWAAAFFFMLIGLWMLKRKEAV
jgi:cytochrome c oxidase cbb3-type subunit 2